MSQNSPAKHERIERHIMRQRGAGARTVNADFGFSFAGFSAPTSQEATPTAEPSEPPAKRRRTIVEGGEKRTQPAKSDALDRRGKTKAARAKRRFVVDVDDRPTVNNRGSNQDAEDSFVGTIGAKKRTTRGKASAKESKDVSGELDEPEIASAKSVEIPKTASKRPTKKKQQRKGQKAEDEAATPREDTNAPKYIAPPKTKSRTVKVTKKTAPVVDEPIHDARAEEPSLVVEQPPQKKASRQRAPRKQKADRLYQHGDAVMDGSIVKATDPTITSKPTESVASKLDIAGPPAKVTCKGKNPSPPTEDVEPEPTAKVTRKRKALAPSVDDVEEAPPPKQSRKVAKSKATSRQVLDRTPPHLERRPLQEADANRSPSPRKSPLEPGKSETLQESGSRSKSAKKKGNTIVEKRPPRETRRAGRKLRVQVDEAQGDAVIEVAKGMSDCKIDENSLAEVRNKAAADAVLHAAANNGFPTNAKSEPDEDAMQAAQPISEKPSKTHDEEEDIDWLFAAAPARQHKLPAAAAHRPKTSATARKTKLADIDLDDLLADVAAFAPSTSSTNTGTTDPARSSVRKTSKAR